MGIFRGHRQASHHQESTAVQVVTFKGHFEAGTQQAVPSVDIPSGYYGVSSTAGSKHALRIRPRPGSSGKGKAICQPIYLYLLYAKWMRLLA